MKKYLLVCACLLASVNNLHGFSPKPETGDFIFVDLDCGEICEAIEKVTLDQFQVEGPRLSHVGLIRKSGSKLEVLEAWPIGGVRATPWSDFLKRKQSLILLARPQASYQAQVQSLLQKIESLKSSVYDNLFLKSNGAYYCSELFAEALPQVFKLRPMHFGHPESKEFLIWQKHYHQYWLPVPSGAPGISPLGVYLDGLQSGMFSHDKIWRISVNENEKI